MILFLTAFQGHFGFGKLRCQWKFFNETSVTLWVNVHMWVNLWRKQEVSTEFLRNMIITFQNYRKCENCVSENLLSLCRGNWKDIPSYLLQSTISLRLMDQAMKFKFPSYPRLKDRPKSNSSRVLKITWTHSIEQRCQIFDIVSVVFFSLKNFSKIVNNN